MSTSEVKTVYDKAAYDMLERVVNGLADKVIEEIRRRVAAEPPPQNGVYRVTEAHVRDAILQVIDRLKAEATEEHSDATP